MATSSPSPTPSLSPSPSPSLSPSPSPSMVSSDFASALPTWLLVALLVLVGLVVLAMFALTVYNLSAPRSALKRIIGKNQPADPELVKTLATSARVGTRTTRTILAIAGFSLLGVAIIAVFGLSGQGVRDLRNEVVAAVTTLVAAISGFYFGARTAEGSAAGGEPTNTAPGLAPDPKNPGFTEGQPGTYSPILTGTPTPTVSLSAGPLPDGLELNPNTGAISGTPAAGSAGQYPIRLAASNGISPNVTMSVALVVSK